MVLYFGNILSRRGGSVGFIETIVPKLSLRYELRFASSVRNKFLRLLHMVFTLLLNAGKARVAIIDTFSTQAFWFAYIVSRVCLLMNIPYIIVLRGGNFRSRIDKSPVQSRRLLMDSAVNVSPSVFLTQELTVRNYKVEYIPNFIDLPQYAFKRRTLVQPRLLWVRAFHKIYNPLMAIDVLSGVRKRYPSAELCMVGADTDGILSQVKRKVVEYKMDGDVKFTGRLLKKEWIKLSEDYDIFINTTHIDNMPVSVIEAMALGFPVVSTRVGGIPYLLEDRRTALLTDDADVQGMTDAILEILEKSDLADALSNSARAKAETFDWNCVSQQWFSVLDNFENPKV